MSHPSSHSHSSRRSARSPPRRYRSRSPQRDRHQSHSNAPYSADSHRHGQPRRYRSRSRSRSPPRRYRSRSRSRSRSRDRPHRRHRSRSRSHSRDRYSRSGQSVIRLLPSHSSAVSSSVVYPPPGPNPVISISPAAFNNNRESGIQRVGFSSHSPSPSPSPSGSMISLPLPNSAPKSSPTPSAPAAAPAPSVAPSPPGEISLVRSTNRPATRYCWVFLVMLGDSYIPGALIGGYSLKQSARTQMDTVCMITADVTETARDRLALLFDRVYEVPYLTAHCVPLKTAKQQAMYQTWVDRACTKWNCLGLQDYEKVMFIDADKIALDNMDHLFEMEAPAATFSSPWSEPYIKSKQFPPQGEARRRGPGIPNPYQHLKHGDTIAPELINSGLYRHSFVLIGTIVLLKPHRDLWLEFCSWLSSFNPKRPFGYQTCNSMMDEQSLTVFFHSHLPPLQNSQSPKFPFLPSPMTSPWRYIHQRYNFVPWHRGWLGVQDRPYVFHFFNTKPWVLKRRDWMDLEAWWQLVQHLGGNSARLTEEQRDFLMAVFDKDDRTAEHSPGCCWCKYSRLDESVWKSHSIFSQDTGLLECPTIEAVSIEEVPATESCAQSEPSKE